MTAPVNVPLTREEVGEIEAILITCDGKGKEAKRAALERFVGHVIDSTLEELYRQATGEKPL